MRARIVAGVGVNDADYDVKVRIRGFVVVCPFYQKWKNMLTRCYSNSYQLRKPAYIGCVVCAEWLVFSNFKRWMEGQDWGGKELDKDLLVSGNKIYSPETCVFINESVNLFLTDRANRREKWMTGVDFHKISGKFRAQCRNQITKNKEYLGLFDSESAAHATWKKRKHEIACQLADLQTDERVANSLRTRYLETEL
jgi:hypothetical protein